MTMAAGRLAGDVLTLRFGPRAMVRGGTSLAADFQTVFTLLIRGSLGTRDAFVRLTRNELDGCIRQRLSLVCDDPPCLVEGGPGITTTAQDRRNHQTREQN